MNVYNGLDLRSRRITSLADPTSAQDAATKAYVDAHGGGWTQIGATIATTSGSSAAFTSIPTTYADLLLVVEGISHNSGSSQSIRLELSDDGTNWTSPIAISDVTGAASVTFYGTIAIPGYRLATGVTAGALSNRSADRTGGAAVGGILWRIAAGIQAVRISVSSGAFDAGTVKLFGR